MNNVLKKIISIVLSTVMAVSSMTVIGFTTVSAAESAVTIYACEGVQEAAYVEWAAVSGTDHYYVSYAKRGNSNFTQIDDELIRQYPDRWRADLVGLSAGDYTIKVTCKDSGGSTIAEGTQDCTVIAHDRTGFTFSPKSIAYDNGGCGAYNADGALKDGANVLYITEDNFDTVTLTLKDKNNDNYTATGLVDICYTMGQAAQKGYSNPPLAVRFLGTIGDSHNGLASKQILETKAKENNPVNITFEGIGDDTIFDGLGLRLNGVANCEIRNIAFYNWHDDAIQLQGNENSNHWIHNNDLFYGENHGGDQKKGDGATDIKDDSRYVTYSYNHYWDSGKTSLCGMKGETGDNYISYHHNWFDHSDSRHPRIRTMFVHVYNNYYDGNSKYGVGAAQNSSAFVEGNYFRNCKYPMLTSMQGSDIASDGTGTFSKENGGVIKAYNNFITGGKGVVYYNENTAPVEYDAYLASSRDEAVPSTVKAKQGGKTFDNSNVDDYILSIPVEEPEIARDKAVNYAGRTGNDFLFTFNNSVDDTDYEINTALASAVETYVKNTADDFVSYGGASDGSGPVATTTTTTEATTEAPTETTTEKVTEVTTFSDPVEVGEAQTGFVSDDAADTGDGVSVTYDEETNRWMLMDTSKTAAAELTIPFAEQTSGKIVISGTVEPSTTASKWMFVQIRGTKADGTSAEIIAFGGGSDKADLSVRVNGASTYNKVGSLSAKNYKYTLVIDLDNKTADVNIDGVKNTYNLDVASINSLYSTTSKSGQRNVTVSVPYVGVLSDDVPPSSETTTETTSTVTESSSETTTENVPDPSPSDKVYGDVDGNGKLEINDASLLIDMVLNGAVEVKDGITDVTNDGKVDTADIATILQKILDSSWNMPCEPDDTTESTTSEVTTVVTTTETTTKESGEEPSEEPTESTTVETTDETTEVTTENTSEETTEPVNNDSFYDFNDNPVVTKDGTEGIIYTVSTKEGETTDGLTAEAVIADNGGSLALHLNDLSETDTVKATIPLTEKNSGVVTYTFKITPSTAAGSWTIAQLKGVKADGTEGEVLGLRTNKEKNYGLRVNSGSDVTASSVVSGANTAATVIIVVDFDNDTASLSVNGSTPVTASGVDAKSITSMSFQTATGARSLYADDAGIIENGEMPTESTTESSSEGTTEEPAPSGSYVHNFTSDGTSSSFFEISGSLSTSKGTVNYNGMTLTQCLKMETATSIKFTAPSAGKLTLVFNSADNKKNCKIDGEKYDSDANGILTADLTAGAHEITKRDTSNLFYMVFTPNA